MKIDEASITKAIVKSFVEDLSSRVETDVVIVGAGPAGVTAARYLAKEGLGTVIFEKELYVGGGMWGGGFLFPKLVIQEEAKVILDEANVCLKTSSGGYYVADSVEAVSKCTASAIDAGAKIFVGVEVEDVVVRNIEGILNVCGAVINWSAVRKAGLHVDPIAVKCKAIVDATGHDASVVRVVTRKFPELKLPTLTGGIVGERSMWCEEGEKKVVEYTSEVLPGLYVAGMAASTVYGAYRMGPIFGGMFLSGKRVAELILKKLKS
ncbi:MAG: sulfide-dependent adenosine diphosphate thiazole synthase [Candidatus Bathyarchaeota archaeon]|nr:sulfide-dependent adenosine diphosphate thiazole synthase [Candidatus Bathyarchaeota archaeon]